MAQLAREIKGKKGNSIRRSFASLAAAALLLSAPFGCGVSVMRRQISELHRLAVQERIIRCKNLALGRFREDARVRLGPYKYQMLIQGMADSEDMPWLNRRTDQELRELDACDRIKSLSDGPKELDGLRAPLQVQRDAEEKAGNK